MSVADNIAHSESRIRLGYYCGVNFFGGGEVYLKALLEHLDYRRFFVKFFCHTGCPVEKIFENVSQQNYEVIYLPRPGSPEGRALGSSEDTPSQPTFYPIRSLWRSFSPEWVKLIVGNLRFAAALGRRLRPHKVELFHLNGLFAEEAIPLAARLSGAKAVVATLHTPPIELHRWGIGPRFIELCSAWAIDLAIAPCRFAEGAWRKRTHIPSHKIALLYYGLPGAPPIPDLARLRREFDIMERRPILGVNARFHPMKGHIYLLRAFPLVLQRHPNAVLLLAGAGPLQPAMMRLAEEMGITRAVRFLGHRTDAPSLNWLYDVAVLPSSHGEIFPFALLEAMACARPVVATRINGVPEMIPDGSCGLLVPPRDSNALAEALLRVLDDPELAQRMGKAGQERVTRLYDERTMIERTLALYDRLLERF